MSDYDAGLKFYVDTLGFDLIEDTPMGPEKRWVMIAPPGSTGTRLLLARAASEQQTQAIGNQTGGRVGFFLTTDQFQKDYDRMKSAGVHFEEDPRHEPYGWVVVFQDPWGNRWDLLERNS